MRLQASRIALAIIVGLAGAAGSRAEERRVPSAPQRWARDGDGGTPGFTRHIVPLFGKLGCNNRACHGSFQGQNGFRLSLFGFEPEADLKELVQDEGGGPRADVTDPDSSPVILKPTRQRAHKGGLRMEVGSWQHRMFRQWIADGARYDPKREPRLVRFEMTPAELILRKLGETAAVRTTAYFSDGTCEDVTGLTLFTSNDQAIATISDTGEVAAVRAGDTAIVAQYGGGVAATQVLVPFPEDGRPFPPFPPHNKVDELVLAKLRKLGLRPSELCSDEVFLRRVYLDVIGTLPTADEARRFLSDQDPAKRARLIDRLLDRPEYAVYWAMKFSDWTGNGPYIHSDPTKPNWMWQLWLEDKLGRNVAYDQIVRGYVCATSLDGRPREEMLQEIREVTAKNEGRGNFDDGTYARRQTLDLYWIKVQHRDIATIALQTADAFLGVRLECAQCHNHPFDRWTQHDYESFKSIFGFVRFCDPATGKDADGRSRGYGRESVEPGLNRRFTNQVRRFPPKLLGGPVIVAEQQDPREALWEWMRSPDNEYLAPALVNRLWAHYFGRGIVHAADDFNQGNPASNPALLDWLARDFIDHRFDLKHVHRTILNSRTYQLCWRPDPASKLDTSNYSHAILRRLPAEVLMDAIAQVTGVPDDFSWVPRDRGRRAVGQASPPVRHSLNRAGYPMTVFGRPDREKTCDCERSNEPSVAQALYLINDQQMHAKITSPTGNLARLVKEIDDDRALLEELYLAALARYPTQAEVAAHLEHVAAAPSRLAGFQDALWSLLNVREFIFNH